jgi:hypothetical protein
LILHASPYTVNLIDSPDCDLYHRISRKVMRFTWLSDRTESIIAPFSQYIPDEYKIPENTPVGTFQDVCQQRCLELIQTNKPLYLQWSGGIDSTLMLTSFITSGLDLDQITICMNPDSIRENPNFFYKNILGKFPLVSTEKHVSTKNYGITIQAEHADQIISGMLLTKTEDGFDRLPANERNISKLCMKWRFTRQEIEAFNFMIQKSAKHSPRPIDTMADFAWWFNFNFRWLNQKEKYRSRIGYNNQFETFYSSHDIQRWSMQNVSPSKTIFRDIIYNFTKDQNYSSQKNKWQSMGKLFFTRKPNLVEKDLTCHYDVDQRLMKRFYVKDNDFIGW